MPAYSIDKGGARGGAQSASDAIARVTNQFKNSLTKKQGPRTFQPVRRNSYNVGEREDRLWTPVDKREIGARLKAAAAFDRTQRQAGERWGPLGPIGLEVLQALYDIVNPRTGRLDPSLDFLMNKIKRSRHAIVRALARLKSAGFVDWIRRSEPIEGAQGPGPRVRQASNAYWFKLPAKAAALVARITGKDAPLPADVVQREADRKAEAEWMIDRLPVSEQGTARFGNSDMGSLFDRLGALIDERESPSGPESLEGSI
jgi:hypothetical protein